MATLTTNDVWEVAFGAGGGVKFRLMPHMLVRAELRDYLTAFPPATDYPRSAQIRPCSPLGKLWRVSQPYGPGATPVWTTYTYNGSDAP